VLTNWERELARWGEHLPDGGFVVEKVHGADKADAWARVKARVSDIGVGREGVGHGVGEPAMSTEIVLTAYDTFRLGVDEMTSQRWSVVIFDEAHRLKNDKTMLYEAARRLPRERRFGLTGTVMQNSYDELWCLLDWACPGSLGGLKAFKEYYSKYMQQAQRFGADDYTLGRGRDRADQLKRLLRRYVLKRTKKVVLAGQLPEKSDNVVFCELSPLQRRVYRRLLDSPDMQLLVRFAEDCDCGSGERRSSCCYAAPPDGVAGNEEQYPIWHNYDHTEHRACPHCMSLVYINILLRLSNHLELLKPDHGDEDKEKVARDEVVAKFALGEDAHLLGGADRQDNDFARISAATNCGKLLALEKLLEIWHRANDKVLLFSKSTRLLDILEKFLSRRGYVYCRLDGGTAQNARQPLVDDFNNSSSMFVFLLSTKAGGVGLNITSANRVVVFDPDWNPALDLQAQDRAYRIGQRRDVNVYRFIAADTIEEIVYQRQVYKQQQSNVAVDAVRERRYFEGVQGDKRRQGELFGLENLFTLAREGLTRMDGLVRRERVASNAYYTIEKAMDKVDKADGGEGGGVKTEKSRWRGGGGGERATTSSASAPSDGDRRASADSIASPSAAGGAGPGGRGGRGRGRPPRGRGRRDVDVSLDREEHGVVYEHEHNNILGRATRTESARSERALRLAREKDAAEDDAIDERARLRLREETAAAAAKRSRPRRIELREEDGDHPDHPAVEETATERADGDAVVAALAAFEGLPPREMARDIASMTTTGRAALLRRFIIARRAA
jgi:superfamily II DNA or RNA helicase